jgi:hypothetical protein
VRCPGGLAERGGARRRGDGVVVEEVPGGLAGPFEVGAEAGGGGQAADDTWRASSYGPRSVGYDRVVLGALPEMEGALVWSYAFEFAGTGRDWDRPVERFNELARALIGPGAEVSDRAWEVAR